jgi:hypothetical protein
MVLFSQKCPAVEPGGRAQTVYCCTVAAIQWSVAVNLKNTIRALFSVIYTRARLPSTFPPRPIPYTKRHQRKSFSRSSGAVRSIFPAGKHSTNPDCASSELRIS